MKNEKHNTRDQIRAVVDRLGHPSIRQLNQEIARLERRESYRRVALGTLVSLVAVAAMIVIVTNLWLAVLQVDGSSMNPLLQTNEIVLVVRKDNPARNDIVAFTHNNKIYIKRVIAVGGDQVEIGEDGTVSVKGRILDEPYVTELSRGSCDIEFPCQVPPETFFVLGDNRPASLDSRDGAFGMVGREQIIGRLVCRIWPLKRWKILAQ